jgi:hypothetical protein
MCRNISQKNKRIAIYANGSIDFGLPMSILTTDQSLIMQDRNNALVSQQKEDHHA